MTILTDEMKEIITKVKVFPAATASKAGIPNVAPMASVMLRGEDTIWIGDNYMLKTLANLKENPVLAVYAWDPESKKCLQMKGEVTIRTEGAEYEEMRAVLRAKNEAFPAKSLIILKVTEVFTCVPGKDAGKKIA
ncbi:pyridoxamine 5'-phosphate oxidase family protein [Methanosphaerula subterraneus]|uniref:pyridoxamine 5'-phosphate oxidase family protein n=1 Tax=Methanosphaerula subterraneus TaxID=3350244 RepID=UPI003F86A6EC